MLFVFLTLTTIVRNYVKMKHNFAQQLTRTWLAAFSVACWCFYNVYVCCLLHELQTSIILILFHRNTAFQWNQPTRCNVNICVLTQIWLLAYPHREL